MKKLRMKIVFALILCLVISLVNMTCFAAANLYVDIEALQNQEKNNIPITYNDMYGCYVMPCELQGQYCSLGTIDLSQYDTVTFLYGCDVSAVLENEEGVRSYLALTTTGAVQNEGSITLKEGVNIIGKVEVPTPDVNWGADEISFTFESDYNGEVFFSPFLVVQNHCVLVSEIIFSDSSYEEPTPSPTEVPEETPVATQTPTSKTDKPQNTTEPDSENSDETAAIIITIAIAAVVISIVSVVIVKKKKS